MERTGKISKLFLTILLFSMIAITMNGCVYVNNKNWKKSFLMIALYSIFLTKLNKQLNSNYCFVLLLIITYVWCLLNNQKGDSLKCCRTLLS